MAWVDIFRTKMGTDEAIKTSKIMYSMKYMGCRYSEDYDRVFNEIKNIDINWYINILKD
jgi:hypothetical protein